MAWWNGVICRRLTCRKNVRAHGGECWNGSSMLFCGVLTTVETVPIVRKRIPYIDSPEKMQCLRICVKWIIKCWTSCNLRVVCVWALTIHNGDLIDADWMPGWIVIITRSFASWTVVRKHSFVILDQRVSNVICLIIYSLVWIDLEIMQGDKLTCCIASA
jgi:hypothetical protein